MEPVSLFDAISPWWWLGAGIAFAALEMLTATTLLIWPGLAATIVFLVLLVRPEMGLTGQITLFSLLTIILVFIGKAFVLRKPKSDAATALNNRAETIVGKTGTIDHEGDSDTKVIIDGIPWPVRSDTTDLPHRSRVRVTGRDGIVLDVEPLDATPAQRP